MFDAVQDMRRKIEEALEIEEELLEVGDRPTQDDEQAQEVDLKFVAQCFKMNERGDGTLYSHLNRDKHIYVKVYEQWLIWAGHHWQADNLDYHHNSVDQVAQQYQRIRDWLDEMAETARTAGEDDRAKILSRRANKYRSRIDKLRDITGARNCLQWAHKIGDDSLAITGEELDQEPLLLPCKNCVVDLSTGKTVESRQGDWLLKAVNVEWKGIDAPCPTWRKFFSEIHQDDEEMIEFVHSLLGYATTGLMTEHFIACFLGEGRNGKGTMFETIRAILGDLAWNVSPELLLDQRNARSASGPSPELVSLQGRRMVLASETDESRRISSSKVKMLTGNDTINARSPHEKKEFNFRPSHKLFLYTNHLPHGLAKDYALSKRLLLINYPLKFIDDPQEPDERKRDPNLPEKLAAESSGILAWLVEGALKWRASGGLKPPDRIRNDVSNLRLKEDTILRFFGDHLEEVGDKDMVKVRFSDLYERYKSWWEEEESESTKYMPSKIAVSQWLVRRGLRREKEGGTAYIYGVQLRNIV